MSEGAVAGAGSERVVAIAIDGSDNAKYAFDFYTKYVHRENDKVYLVNTIEINSVLHSTQWYSSPYTFDKEMLIKMLNEEKAKIRHKLEGYAELLKEASIDGIVKSIHAESPGEGIVKAVQEIDAALVVVGCRGLGRLRRTLMGSVSDYVLHHVHIPVLICRHQHDAHHKQHK